MRLGALTWDEAEPLLPRCVMVLPVGAGCKEHGHHLPLENDLLLAEALAARLEPHPEVLLLPTLSYGFYPAFADYPGSISLEHDTMRDTVVSIGRSLLAHGARRFYVLNTGISTLRPLKAAAELLPDCEYGYLNLLEVLEGWPREQPGGTHADELETSMMLYLTPDRVRMDRARPDYHGEGPGPLRRTPGAGLYSPTGAWGDPTLASREKGERLVEALMAHIWRDLGL